MNSKISFPKCNQASIEFYISTDEEMREALHYLSEDFPIAMYNQHFRFDASDQIPFHWHDDLQLSWVSTGEVEYQLHGDRFTIAGDRLLLINRQELHCSRPSGGDASTLCINFTPDIFHPLVRDKYILPFLEKAAFPYVLLSLKPHQSTVLKRFLSWKSEPLEYISVMNFLSQFFEDLLQEHEEKNDPRNDAELVLFQTILNYVHTHYAEPLSVKELSSFAAVSKNLLTAMFNKYTNMPPIRYLNAYRLNAARSMLIQTDPSRKSVPM